MAEHLSEIRDNSTADAMGMIGRPIPNTARAKGHEACRDMGLDTGRAFECVNAVTEQLERDKPYEAMTAGCKYLDLIGTYRLFAVLLTESALNDAEELHTWLLTKAVGEVPA